MFSFSKSIAMIIIRRILFTSLAVIGSLFAIIVLAIINAIANTGLTGGQIVLYGLIAGVVLGIVFGYLLIRYLVAKARKFIHTRFGHLLSRFGIIKQSRP